MIIKQLNPSDCMWKDAADYANQCSWRSGKNLAKHMYENDFCDWERVFVALDNSRIAGYCTLSKNDCIPDVPYTPYIGYVFVDEAYRGNRCSQRLINAALMYAKELGFEKVYLVSDHINLYEKCGFIKIDEKPALWNPNTLETIFMYSTAN